MKIQCQNCGVEHQIDPPSWVVSSGRAFRFRCSSCGYSQSVQPTADDAQTPAPAPVSQTPTVERRAAPPREQPERPPEEPRAVGPTITPWEDEVPRPPAQRVAHLGPNSADRRADPASSAARTEPANGGESGPAAADNGRANAVFLKQNGQIYMVSDWDTLRRWIAESRVDRHDLVSEGGVRWEPIGSRPDLLGSFVGPEVVPAAPIGDPSMFPFGGETPFGQDTATLSGWHDDDTEGIPTGLPPLPTDEVVLTGFEAATARPRTLTPTPPPVARRLPPPVMRAPTPLGPLRTPTPSGPRRAVVPPPTNLDEPVPPALPDTVPPPPLRARPYVPRVTEAEAGHADIPITWAPVDHPDETPTEQGSPRRATDAAPEPRLPRDVPTLPPLDHGRPTEIDDEPAVVRRSAWPVVLAGLFVVAVFLALAVAVAWPYVFDRDRARVPVPSPSLPVRPDPLPVPAPVLPDPVVPAPRPDPAQPAPVEPVDPAPVDPAPVQSQPEPPRPVPAQPVPAQPVPRPAQPRTASVKVLVERGWGLADRGDLAGARDVFQEALSVSPDNVDASYGYGYALMSLGSPGAARPYLCVALARGETDTQREARGQLDKHGLTCP